MSRIHLSWHLFYNVSLAAAQRMAARAVGTALAAGAALFGVKALKEKRESGATVELYNALAAKGDLSDLTRADIEAIQAKYDVNLAGKRVDEVKAVYDTFVESVIPVGSNLTCVSALALYPVHN